MHHDENIYRKGKEQCRNILYVTNTVFDLDQEETDSNCLLSHKVHWMTLHCTHSLSLTNLLHQHLVGIMDLKCNQTTM